MSSPPPSRRSRTWRSLRALALDPTPLRQSRDFRYLFTGQIASIIGNQVTLVAVPWLVYKVTGSSLAVGLVSLAEFVPSVFFALGGGALADVMDRRTLMRITQTLIVLLSLALAVPVLSGWHPLWYVFVLVGLAAGVQAVGSPTRRAALPNVVGREQLANALAFDQVTFQLGAVVGPALAGLLIGTIGIGPTLVINAGTPALSLATLMFISPLPPGEPAAGSKRGLAAVREGLVFLKDQPIIMSTMLIDINATFFGMPLALFPALATHVFKTGAVGVGLLYAAPSTGAFLGALVTGWVGRVRRQGRAIVIAVCIWGVAIALFGTVTRAFWLGLGLLAIAGMADMYSAIFRGNIVQIATPDHLRGRLSAVHFIAVTTGPRLGDVEAGTVATLTTTQISVISGGIGALIGGVLIALLVPSFLRFDARQTAETVA